MSIGFSVDAFIGARHTVRSLRRSPAYLAGAVTSLSLAIAATVTVFAVMNDLVLQPPPWRHPGEIAILQRGVPGSDELESEWSVQRFDDLRRAIDDRVPAAAYALRAATVTSMAADSGIRADAEFVSATYMPMLGRLPVRGRAIDSASYDPGSVVIRGRLARQLFGTDDPLGRTLHANGIPLVVIGVMGDDYYGLSGRGDLWLPLDAAPMVWAVPEALSQFSWSFEIAVRIPAEWSTTERESLLGRMQAFLAPSGPMVASGSPGATEIANSRAAPGVLLQSAEDRLVEPGVRHLLWILLAAAGCVLLLACTNVASLSAVRLSSRRTELAVRRAIGAPARRLVGASLLEALLIALASAAVGLALAVVARRTAWAFWPAGDRGGMQPPPIPVWDPATLLFTIAVVLSVVVLIGAWPAMETRGEGGALFGLRQHGARSTVGSARIHAALSTTQLGLAFVLASSALLFAISLRALTSVHHGFVPDGILTVRFDLPRTQYDAAAARVLVDRLTSRVAGTARGMVSHIAISNAAPLDGSGISTVGAIDFARPVGSGGRGTSFAYRSVSEDYFRLIGISVAGTTFDAGVGGGPVPVIVNQAAARRYWPDVSPVGQLVQEFHLPHFGGRWTAGRVVGIVPDVQYGAPGAAAEPAFYVRARDDPPRRAVLLARTTGDPMNALPVLRAAVRAVDPRLVLYAPKTMETRLREVSSRTRFGTMVLGAYATVAVAIALIGVYSVIAFGVEQRRAEIAVRMALGASPRRVLVEVLNRGVRLMLAGVAIGVLASIGAQQVIRAHLFGVSATDPRYYALIAVAFALAAAGASLFPAITATKLDPAAILKSEA